MGCKSPVESDGPSPGTGAYWRQLFLISQEPGVLKNNLYFLGCVRDRKLAIGHLAFIATLSSSCPSNRDTQDKLGKMVGSHTWGLLHMTPASLVSPELQSLF